MLIRFNSNRVVDGIARHAGEVDDVEVWRALVDSGVGSLVEPMPVGPPDVAAAEAEDFDEWPTPPEQAT